MEEKIIHKELSYKITGLLFLEKIEFERERELPVPAIDNKLTNKVDFIVEDKIILELKAKPIVQKEDYYQTQKYLQASGHKLGLMINFRNKYLKPIRIIRINS